MSHDTLIHRLVRPGVRGLTRTPVTPNQLTTLRLLFGLAAAGAFALGEGWRGWGALLFLVSLLLDRADGELARQTGRTSVSGYRYDLVCDCVSTVVAFVGLGIGYVRPLGLAAPALGCAAGASVVGLFYQLNVSASPQEKAARTLTRPLADPDDAMTALPVLVWLKLGAVALVVGGVATPAVMLALLLRRRLATLPARLRR